jgi:hypothetical protein
LKISMRLSVILSVVFAAICFGVAINGFSSLGDISDPAQRADGRGFVLFWAFLGAVGAVFALLGVWLLKTYKESNDA